TLKMVMTFDLGFRGDIHGYRSEPGGKPSDPAMTFNHMLTAKGTYNFSGSYDDTVNRYHEDWSGSGTLKARADGSNGLPPVTDNTVYYIGSILDGKWDMLLQANATQGKHVHS